MHCPDNGSRKNVHELSNDKLKQREVVFIDIANDPVAPKVRYYLDYQMQFNHLIQFIFAW